jgi:tRNA threonylcarbamoyladenosine dehydratase
MGRNPVLNRAELLVGPAGMDRLQATRVILFGIGGVGSWTAEALVRSGIGHLTLVDSDAVCITNVNRQVQATLRNVGRPKVDEMAARLRLLNPATQVVPLQALYGLRTKDDFSLPTYDYVVDAIDSLSPKLGLILQCLQMAEPRPTLFATMGASSKVDPTRVRTGSIWESIGDPLARRIRKRLRHHDVTGDFQVVYSDEVRVQQGEAAACGTSACLCPKAPAADGAEAPHEWCSSKAFINGSLVQVTATFGMCLASLVVNDVLRRAGAMPLEKGRVQVAPEGPEADDGADSDRSGSD